MNTVFLILKERIVSYPPVISIMDALLRLNKKVVFIGNSSDYDQKEDFEKRGVKFEAVTKYDGSASNIEKFIRMKLFKRDVNKILKQKFFDGDELWIMHGETVCLLNSLVGNYKTIIHFFEYVDPHLNWKFRILSPSFDMGETCRKAYKVVCCEYNRAHITKGLFQLEELPVILPNKFFSDEETLENPPSDVLAKVNDIKGKVEGKNVILYQGIFLDKERRLEEFIQAVNTMSDDYVLIAMGRGSEMFESLKKKYSSHKILFVDFIKPPFHLLVTKLAKIGVLSYFPRNRSIATVLNPLYCAPNKTFEYGRYGAPMISNDVPALAYLFSEYHCGEIVEYPVTGEKIKDKIEKIMGDYENYSKSAVNYYNSIDIIEIISKIVE